MPNIWNGTMFGDLDWPLNASRGFVSIRWASYSTWHTVLRWQKCQWSVPMLRGWFFMSDENDIRPFKMFVISDEKKSFFPATTWPHVLPFETVTRHFFFFLYRQLCFKVFPDHKSLSILRLENCLIKLDISSKPRQWCTHLLFIETVLSKYKENRKSDKFESKMTQIIDWKEK